MLKIIFSHKYLNWVLEKIKHNGVEKFHWVPFDELPYALIQNTQNSLQLYTAYE